MNRIVFAAAFAVGLLTVGWVAIGFVGSSPLALTVTLLIAGVYGLGAWELKQFRAATAALERALHGLSAPPDALDGWLAGVPASLRNPVRMRVEGERVGLPGPALTPYLVGLLVMLGMLGTFLGMVVTFKGAVFALEGSTDLQAIRAALAAPIKGLGLSFGASVAGVAASAMLGLLSALSRRERLDVARLLDSRIATVLRPFSLTHQRQEALRALQLQARALPDVADQLKAMMDAMERRSQQLGEHLSGQQAQFHREASLAYGELARAVGASLQDSLAASAKAAGDSLKPIVEEAMTQIAQESSRVHLRQVEATQQQLDGLWARFGATAQSVSEGWTQALDAQASAGARLVGGLEQALQGFTDSFQARSGALVDAVQQALSRGQAEQAAADRERLQGWTQALEGTAKALRTQWQTLGEQALAQQQTVGRMLEQSAADVAARASEHAGQALGDIERLLAQSDALVRTRIESEARWTQEHGARMDQLAGLWGTELRALRQDEAERGQAAVERLGELQAALASQLATLGAALEAPMSRLMHTAAEVPQAAAGVIAQLREELARLTERDNLALRERAALIEQVGALLQTIQQGTGEQRAAIESLVGSAGAVLEQAASRFAQTLDAQAGQAADVAAQVTGSAVELASLGEAFNHGVQLFSATHDKLIDSLQRLESAIGQSMARSDEQLAYYVAQAREVIDLSISSQQGIVEDLRRLRSEPTLLAEAGA